MRKIPARYAGLVMPFLLSVFMTCVVSAISILRSTGFSSQFLHLWPGAWLLSWAVAFPVLLLVLPVVRRLTVILTEA